MVVIIMMLLMMAAITLNTWHWAKQYEQLESKYEKLYEELYEERNELHENNNNLYTGKFAA